MSAIQNKIDFSVVVTVTNANPNGDPLCENRPRENYDGYGEISDVCIKRKIRNRLQDMGEKIFVQSDERCDDGAKSLAERLKNCSAVSGAPDKKAFVDAACETWTDVRSFGQLFAYKKDKEKEGLSVGIRGPVSIRQAVSVDRVNIIGMQITKSVNGEGETDKLSSDRMGMKYYVDFATYVFHGSINCQLAEKTGFSDEDAEKIKQALCTLFENDASSARPDGSMEVKRVYWYRHNAKTPSYSSAKVHSLLHIELKKGVSKPSSFNDYVIALDTLDGLTPEVFKG